MLKEKEVSNIPSLYLGGGVIHMFYFDPYLGKISKFEPPTSYSYTHLAHPYKP